ncbi:MAG: DUF2868 domain-containing protein [Gammaproteobacteria bacterium]|nr:DUF2868 domain-containing protein [Gammaproteobacteria bacterium]
MKIAWPFILLGGAIGFLLSWMVLSGDQQGRVNIFYLLLVYLFIPLLSILASVFSLLFGKGINLARLVVSLPLWSFQSKDLIRKIQQLNLDKSWFLMQSQAAAIAFSLASLTTYFVLLLATDLNFVWRSTILNPIDIFPFLKLVAMPWSFWEGAQPSIDLLEMTRDSRMAGISNPEGDYGVWWKFILATQLFYSFLLRVLLIIWSRVWIRSKLSSDIEQRLQKQLNKRTVQNEDKTTSVDIVDRIPDSLLINNWHDIPENILQLIPHIDLTIKRIEMANWQESSSHINVTNEQKSEQLLIVKAWEPPMGEMEDFMKTSRGYLLPLDWNESGLRQLQNNHLQEWQRFINHLPQWKLYIPIKGESQ